MTKKPRSVEAQIILSNLDSETLSAFIRFANSSEFEFYKDFARRYAETKRNQIIDLPTEDERKLANGVAIRKGSIYTAGVFVEVVLGAQKELNKREKKDE